MNKPATKLLLLSTAALIAGMGTFAITRSQLSPATSATSATLLDELPELAWLRKELALTDEQFARIGHLHAAYRPVCEEMCHRIDESLERLETVAMRSRSTGPELEEAIKNHERVRAECKMRMLEHLYEISRLMSDQQAERYLAMVLPAALGSAAGKESHH